MKTKRVMMTLVVLFFSMAALMAKDLKTVLFKVEQLKCENCVRKMSETVKSTEGLADLTTDLTTKTVTVTYDAEQTTVEDLQKAFGKSNYTTVVVTDKEVKECAKAAKDCPKEGKEGKECCKKEAGGECCSKKK